jgi:hypothetical protein
MKYELKLEVTFFEHLASLAKGRLGYWLTDFRKNLKGPEKEIELA